MPIKNIQKQNYFTKFTSKEFINKLEGKQILQINKIIQNLQYFLAFKISPPPEKNDIFKNSQNKNMCKYE